MVATVTSNAKQRHRPAGISGSRNGHSGTHKERIGKVMMWGDNGYARATTEQYRDNHDQVFGGDSQKKEEQRQRTEEFKAEKERLRTLMEA